MDNTSVVQWYVSACCNGGLNEKRVRGGTLFVNADGELFYQRRAGYKSTAWGPATLGYWNRRGKLFVLNGDGFTDRHATGWQTNLRRTVRTQITNMGRDAETGYILVPFLALDAAGVDKNTIRVVEMQEDGFELVWHPVSHPPQLPETPPSRKDLPKGWTLAEDYSSRKTYAVNSGDERWQVTAQVRYMYEHRVTKELRDYIGYAERSQLHDWEQKQILRWIGDPMVWGVPERGTGNWQRTTPHSLLRPNINNEWVRDHPDPGPGAQGWIERVHNLGACVFSARGTDGKRHLYVSAFDEQERRQPMYFLAQLPDQAKTMVSSYSEALHALAPPLVHQARENGIPVYRQGDVFAIETDLTDEQVYANCRTRVRRDIVLARTDQGLLFRVFSGNAELPEPAEGEVAERVPCELCHQHRRRIGNGPKAQRALSIYRTGHTATEVVVADNGTTYVRGTMHHDPFIEERGRTREHQDVMLHQPEQKAKWCVALRNTVPRRKIRRTEDQNV